MSFLTKAQEGGDLFSEEEIREELYMKLVPKIGRDFIHVEDLIDLLTMLFNGEIYSPAQIASVARTRTQARRRAEEYKQFLRLDQPGNTVYRDLINLDD